MQLYLTVFFSAVCSRPKRRTVNDEKEMVMAASWGLDVVLTDLPTRNLSLGERSPTLTAFDAVKRKVGLNSWIWPWSKWRYWGVAHVRLPSTAALSVGGRC
jgi:hypothetical protein